MPKGEVTRPSNAAIKRLRELGRPAEARIQALMAKNDRELGNADDKEEASRLRLAMEDEEAKRLLDELAKKRMRERGY